MAVAPLGLTIRVIVITFPSKTALLFSTRESGKNDDCGIRLGRDSAVTGRPVTDHPSLSENRRFEELCLGLEIRLCFRLTKHSGFPCPARAAH